MEFNSYINALSSISIRKLIGGGTLCHPEWGEEDSSYNYCKVLYYTQGESVLRIKDDYFHPKPGELYLIPANTRHSFAQNPENPVFLYWFHLDIRFGGEQRLVYHPEAVCCLPSADRIISLCQRLMALKPQEFPADKIAEQAILIELIYIFFREVDYTKLFLCQEDDFVKKINEYVAIRLQERITLNELAQLSHLHPNYFIPYFQKYFSLSPIEYINSVRLGKALDLLASTSDNIQYIAQQVGFRDSRYFSRQFKKRYGFTPTFYRNIHVIT